MNRKRSIIIAAALLTAIVFAALWFYNPVPQTDTGAVTPSGECLTVSFIDVGQALSVLITDGQYWILYDAGTNDTDISEFIKSQGCDKLDYAIGSHAHEDHIGGMDKVLRSVECGTLLLPAKTADTSTYKDIIKAAEENEVPIVTAEAGQEYTLGDMILEILAPVREYDDQNNNSVVLRLAYGANVFLFSGDAETAAEKDIISNSALLSCDVYCAGHHGSDTSSSYVFLRAANPKHIVISCGKDNSYGHPHEGALSRFRDVGATVYRTDELGTVVFQSDGKNITVSAKGEESPVEWTSPDPGEGAILANEYIGNLSSKKFHLPSCSALPAEHNRVVFESREKAVGAGYEPCGSCKP